MLRLTKDTTSEIVVTLKEKETLSSPFYLFEFESKQTRVKQYCVAADTSLSTDRYNQFDIVDTTTPDRTAGEVEFLEAGSYDYKVFEQSNGTNLDPEDAVVGALLEKGMAEVIGTSTTFTKYDSQPKEYIVYGG